MRQLSYLIATVVLLGGCSGPLPSDESLEHRFQTDRAAFEQIKALICAKNQRQQIMMHPEWSDPEITAQDRARYYPLLKRIGARGILSEGNCSFIMPVWVVARTQSRGYSHGQYFIGDKRTVQVTSLDKMPQGQGEVTFYLRPVAQDWNLYHVHWH